MKRSTISNNLLATTAMVLSLAAPVAANAQASAGSGATTEPAEVSGVDTIIVTARRKEERLQDVPLTVNAVSNATLTKLNIQEFKDISSVVPGLALTPAADGVAPTASLRGVNNNVNNSGNNGTVQFYLNDSVVPAAQLFQSLFDIGQVEVLRGPQGTLRGLASPSGSITVTTARPNLENYEGYVMGTVNTIGGINANGAVSVPLVKDILALRVAGIVDDNEANRVSSANDPSFRPYSKTYGERVSLLFHPIDNLEVFGSWQHITNRFSYFDQVESGNLVTGTPLVGQLITAGMRQAMEDTPRRIRSNFNVYNLHVQYEIAGQKIMYEGGVSNFHVIAQAVTDVGGFFDSSYPGNATADPVTAPNLHNFGQLTDVTAPQQTHELRLSSNERMFGFLDYVVGGLINKQVSNDDPLLAETPLFNLPAAFVPFACPGAVPQATALGAFDCINIHNVIFHSHQIEKSVFGNMTVHVGDATEISGGLRYLHFSQDGNFLPKEDFSHTIYSATIKHRFNDHIMAYASTGTAYRVPAGTNQIILSLQSTFKAIDPAFASLLKTYPESSTSYEVGAKTDFFENRLQFNVAYFHQSYHNYIYSGTPVTYNDGVAGLLPPSPTSSGLTVPVPVTVNGAEIEYAIRPSQNFSVDGTVSYALAKITGGLVPCPPGSSAACPPLPAVVDPLNPKQIDLQAGSGRAGPSAPFSATVQTEYTRPITDTFAGFIRGQLQFYGASQNDPLNPYDDIKTYAPVNLYLGLRNSDGGWEVTTYAKNIFNAQRVLSRSNPNAGLLAPGTSLSGAIFSNYRLITMTPEREFGLTIRYAFGSR